jgi:tRNA (guanine26-N2/guanine27-N2)-dimethyltransferase
MVDAGEFVEVREGGLRLLVPVGFTTAGPGTRSRKPFYNPVMALGRDVTILLVGATVDRRWTRFLDGLSATGVLGLRVAQETPTPEVVLCDRNPAAFALMEENARRNGLGAVRVVQDDVRALMVREPFMHIELDPYGPPTPFIDAALQGLYNRGILGITATDTAPLAGTYPKTCIRRYWARPMRAPFGHELGLRILMGFLARSASKFDLAVEPLAAYHAEHFYKVHVRVVRGASRADDALAKLAFALWDPLTGHRELQREPPREGPWAGPLWGGPLGDGGVLGAMARAAPRGSRAHALLERLLEEVDLPHLHHGTAEWSGRLRLSPPPLARVLSGLRERGFKTGRTHLDPQGFRTDAPAEAIGALLQDLASSGGPKRSGYVGGKSVRDLPRGGESVEGGDEHGPGRRRHQTQD